jgi:hypothetical protein
VYKDALDLVKTLEDGAEVGDTFASVRAVVGEFVSVTCSR